MAKYNYYKIGSVDDIKSSFKFSESKISIAELNHEIESEMKFKCRTTLINLYNAAIKRKMKTEK